MRTKSKKYKICLWCIDSPYCWEHVKELSDEFDVFSIAFGRNFGYNFDIHVTSPFNRRPLSTIFWILNIAYIMYLFLKYDRKCDCHLVHYLELPYALAIALLPLKKPIAYCVYGTDVRNPEGVRKKLVKKALEQIDIIFCPTKSFYRKYLLEKYEIAEKKIAPILWYPINPCFKKFDEKTINNLREKWNLTKEYVIFSPRATKEFYNHHLLIEGLGLLNDNLKKKIQVVLTGHGDPGYRKKLVEMGKSKGIDVVDLGRRLSPEEMAEMYNISVITVNIPKVDALGRSNLEAIMCGSILLLNKNNAAYQEIFTDRKYCKLVELNAKDIALGIEHILNNVETLRFEEERLRIINIVSWEKNKNKIIKHIKKLLKKSRRLVIRHGGDKRENVGYKAFWH